MRSRERCDYLQSNGTRLKVRGGDACIFTGRSSIQPQVFQLESRKVPQRFLKNVFHIGNTSFVQARNRFALDTQATGIRSDNGLKRT